MSLTFIETLKEPAIISERSLKYRLFFNTPSIHDWCDEIFPAFIQHAGQQKFSFNWAIHMHLLNWLANNPLLRQRLNATLIEECMQASLIRWSLSGFEHIETKGILIQSSFLPSVACGLWKSDAPLKSHRLVRLSLKNERGQDRYALAYKLNTWSGLDFQTIPL